MVSKLFKGGKWPRFPPAATRAITKASRQVARTGAPSSAREPARYRGKPNKRAIGFSPRCWLHRTLMVLRRKALEPLVCDSFPFTFTFTFTGFRGRRGGRGIATLREGLVFAGLVRGGLPGHSPPVSARMRAKASITGRAGLDERGSRRGWNREGAASSIPYTYTFTYTGFAV